MNANALLIVRSGQVRQMSRFCTKFQQDFQIRSINFLLHSMPALNRNPPNRIFFFKKKTDIFLISHASIQDSRRMF